MKSKTQRLIILIAEDDPDDQLLIRDALKTARIEHELVFLTDGLELMDYLNQRGKFSRPEDAPRPSLILLDLNMPRMDGRKALEEIKSNEKTRRIPVVVFTTSDSAADIHQCYDLGGNAYVVKPEDFDELVRIMKTLNDHWGETAEISPL